MVRIWGIMNGDSGDNFNLRIYIINKEKCVGPSRFLHYVVDVLAHMCGGFWVSLWGLGFRV